MTVYDKIRFAEYFLDKIKNAQNREDFLPNLAAFLSESRSIADYLLQDYNLKFDLGISLTKKLNHRIFKEKGCDKPRKPTVPKLCFEPRHTVSKIGGQFGKGDGERKEETQH